MIYKEHLIIEYDYTHALQSLRPGSVWSIIENDYNTLNWMDETQIKPTKEELDIEIERLQSLYNNKEYQRQRANEYPSLIDQLDILYHNGYDGWKETIKSIKNKYPKT